jgi:hypothetical protein
MKERDTQTEQSAREVTKRSLESGTPVDVIIVENFCKKARVSNDRPFKIVKTRDEVDMQRARPSVSAGNLVERLVRTHTNLQLEHRLELYEAGMLPWDIECHGDNWYRY